MTVTIELNQEDFADYDLEVKATVSDNPAEEKYFLKQLETEYWQNVDEWSTKIQERLLSLSFWARS